MIPGWLYLPRSTLIWTRHTSNHGFFLKPSPSIVPMHNYQLVPVFLAKRHSSEIGPRSSTIVHDRPRLPLSWRILDRGSHLWPITNLYHPLFLAPLLPFGGHALTAVVASQWGGRGYSSETDAWSAKKKTKNSILLVLRKPIIILQSLITLITLITMITTILSLLTCGWPRVQCPDWWMMLPGGRVDIWHQCLELSN